MRQFQQKQNLGNPPAEDSITATRYGAGEFNTLGIELPNACLRAGLTIAPADGFGEEFTQLAEAMMINSVKASTFQAAGSVNAITLEPVSGSTGVKIPASYDNLEGARVNFIPTGNNTGVVTASIGQTAGTQLSTKKVLDNDGLELTSGTIVSGQRIEMIYDPDADSNNGAFLLAPWATSTGGGGTSIGKNYLINSDFDVWQREITFSGFGQYIVDRWVLVNDGASDAITVTRQEFTPGQTDVDGSPTYFMRAALVAGAGGTENHINQRIEDVRLLGGKQVTVTLNVKASSAATLPELSLNQNFGGGGSAPIDIPMGTINVTTSWQKIVRTVTLPSISGKTIGTDSYMALRLPLPLNTTLTVDFSQMKLEEGGEATLYEKDLISDTVAACQYYYWKTYDEGVFAGANTAFGAIKYTIGPFATVELSELPVRFGNRMRIPPVSTIYSVALGTAGSVTGNAGADVVSSISSIGNTGSTVQVGGAVNQAEWHYVADAEL